MKPFPLRFRGLPSGQMLFVDDAGGFFASTEAFLERYVFGTLTNSIKRSFSTAGMATSGGVTRPTRHSRSDGQDVELRGADWTTPFWFRRSDAI